MTQGLTTGGWLFLAAAWSAIIALTAFCFRRVLRQRAQRK